MTDLTDEELHYIVGIVRTATAHNYGQVIQRYQLHKDMALVQVGSWPRAREGKEALEKAGFKAEIRKPTDGSWGEVLEVRK
jgi:hypothetical protein